MCAGFAIEFFKHDIIIDTRVHRNIRVFYLFIFFFAVLLKHATEK